MLSCRCRAGQGTRVRVVEMRMRDWEMMRRIIIPLGNELADVS
jgi:hypothetical protein